jgi:hypothetical protein
MGATAPCFDAVNHAGVGRQRRPGTDNVCPRINQVVAVPPIHTTLNPLYSLAMHMPLRDHINDTQSLDASGPGLVLLTSGASGRPKATVLPRRSLAV